MFLEQRQILHDFLQDLLIRLGLVPLLQDVQDDLFEKRNREGRELVLEQTCMCDLWNAQQGGPTRA